MRRLKHLRRFADLSQTGLSRASGIPQQRLSEFERERKPVDREVLDRILSACVEASQRATAREIEELLTQVTASRDREGIAILRAQIEIAFARLEEFKRRLEPLSREPS